MKNTKFKLADKMGYKSPFGEKPFRKDWEEERKKEEEKREDYTHQYRGKGRQKIQDAYLYVAINDKFEDKKPEASTIKDLLGKCHH